MLPPSEPLHFEEITISTTGSVGLSGLSTQPPGSSLGTARLNSDMSTQEPLSPFPRPASEETQAPPGGRRFRE